MNVNGPAAICICSCIVVGGILIYKALNQGRSIEVEGELVSNTGEAIKGKINFGQPTAAAIDSDLSLPTIYV